MKKTISLILAFVLCLSLCACGGEASSARKTQTVDELLSNAIRIEIRSFLKQCDDNVVKASNEFEGKNCIIEGFVSEINKDSIRISNEYLYVNVYLSTEEIIELQTEQYIEVVGTLENLEYDAYKGAFADLKTACVSKYNFVRTGEYNEYHSTDGTHPQGICLKCADDSGDSYYIKLELSDEQVGTLTSGTTITVNGKLINNYWDTMPYSASLKMIDFTVE